MAPCPHFRACGGCVAQDKSDADYRAWKEGFVLGALHQHSVGKDIDEFISCDPRSRRRIILSFTKNNNEIALGFHAVRSPEIVSIHACPVSRAELIDALPGLRELLQHLAPKKTEGRVTLLWSETGLDAAIEDVKDPSASQRSMLARIAVNLDFARLAINGEILTQLREPILKAGRASYTPPPGAFVQAVAEAEDIMAEKICSALKKHKTKCAADLFAGCGAFALRMAEQCIVHAVEANEAALQALQKAAHQAQGLKPITIEKRDLFRRPLLASELNSCDAVILDPPRQGAQAQIAELCKSRVKLIIYVSCHPGTFARDARQLIAAGYRLEKLDLIDQFLWSEHIELIAIFIAKR
jgi:23S rRNA (uracil1939-C5)-methyltransferase